MFVQNEEDLLRIEKTQKAPKKKLKAWHIALIALGVLVIAGGAVLVSQLFTKPTNALGAAAVRTLNDLKKTGIGEFAIQTAEEGSLNVNADLSKLSRDIPFLQELSDMGVTADITLYRSSGGFAISSAAAIHEKELLDGRLIFSKNALSLSSTAFLGKTSYGLNLKNLAKNLKGSPFDPDENTRYALPQSLYDYLISLDADEWGKLGDDFKKVRQSLLPVISKSLAKYAEASRESERIEIGSDSLSTQRIDVNLDGEAMTNILMDIMRWAKSSKELKSLIKALSSAAEQYSSVTSNRPMDAEDIQEQFYDAIDNVLDNKDEVEDMLKYYRLNMTGNIRRLSGELVQFSATLKERRNGETATIGSLAFSIGPKPSKPEIITLDLRTEDGRLTLNYTVEKNDGSLYDASLKVKADSETVLTGRLNWDKKEDDLTVKLTFDSDSVFTLKAELKKDGDTVIFRPDKLTGKMYGEEETVRLDGLTVTIDKSAKFPSHPTYTDLLTLDAKDLDELTEDLQDALKEISDTFEKALKER